MQTILIWFIFLRFISLSTELCYYKTYPTHIIENEWWISADSSNTYNNVVLCSNVTLNELLTLTFRKNRMCNSYYYNNCEDVYTALIVSTSNVTRLTRFVAVDQSDVKGLRISNSNIQTIEGNAFTSFYNLVEIDLSKNSISSLPDGLFASNNQLKIIDLSNNSIVSIASTTFPTQNLRYLNLQNNKLQRLDFNLPPNLLYLDLGFNSVSEIVKDFFSGLVKLQSITLRHNVLQTLTNGLFTANINLEVIDLSYNNISTVGKVVFFLHRLEKLNMQSNYLKIIDFTLPFSLIFLDISCNKIHEIKHDTFESLNKLFTLRLNNNSLETLPTGLFKSLTKLNTIHLENNKITSLDKELFAFNSELKFINLAKNIISNIEESAFSSQSIELLNLTGNRIQYVNFSLPQSLYYLDLSSNYINEIGESIFYNTSNLKEIYLNNNTLRDIPSGLFRSLNSVNLINLQDNNIITLEDNIFSLNLTSNLTLNLSNNSISILNKDTFPSNGIKYLYMQHNKLKKVSCKLPQSLIHLNLSSNLISIIENDPFNGLHLLQNLWLDNNYLTEIPPGYFKTLNSLEGLYLSNNKLTIAFGTLTGLRNLTSLDMSNNSIIDLEEQMLFDQENLVSLDISKNFLFNFDITDLRKFLGKLKIVHLDDNRFQCLYLWELITRLKDIGISVPKGNKFYESNVQGIECSEIKESGAMSQNTILSEKIEKNLNDGYTKELSQILKEVVAGTISDGKLSKSIYEEKIESTLDKINSNLDFINKISNSSEERFQYILKEFFSNLNSTNQLLNKSGMELHNIFEKSITNLSIAKEPNSVSEVNLLQALEKVFMILNSTSNVSISDSEQLQHSLDLFSSSLNSTANVLNDSYNNLAIHMKSIEDILFKLNKTVGLSVVAEKSFLTMNDENNSVDNSRRNISIPSIKQIEHNIYYPLQTVILFTLLIVIIYISYFLYNQFKIMKNKCNVGSTELDNIVME